MMILSLCNTCLQSYQITVGLTERDLIRRIADDAGHTCPCPRLCGGSINLVGDSTITASISDPRLKSPMRISGTELFKAVKGLGLPDEIEMHIELIGPMLKTGVKDYKLEKVFDKIYLTELKLENGITLHLTSGPHGAQVLKMTKERAHGSGNPG